MWLVQFNDQDSFQLVEYLNAKPPYAILSHTWGPAIDEVLHHDLLTGRAPTKKGYQKLLLCRDQARRDDLQHFWIDTVCIDKSNAVELQEAINSMFRWYQEAAACYVYMSDVTLKGLEVQRVSTWSPELIANFCQSRWFTRGWTLQELLAPRKAKFFSEEGLELGDKTSLESLIHRATGIQVQALRGDPLDHFSVQTRLKWAASRTTTRPEDAAYSLLGLFGICMPLLYGEGTERAMDRLRRKIEKKHQRGLLSQFGPVEIIAGYVVLILIAVLGAFT